MAVLIPDRQAALKALDAVRDPKSGRGIAEAGLVKGLVLRAGRAGFALVVPEADREIYEPVRAEAEAALAAFPGIQRAQVMLAGDDEPAPTPGTVRVRRGAKLSAELQEDATPRKPPPTARPLDHVRHVVAVASGKGGVGKSTVAVNLAVALAQQGLKVGLLDADVYGPSVPRMTGAVAEPEIGPDKKLMPLEAWGLKLMSIGLIVDEGAPIEIFGRGGAKAEAEASGAPFLGEIPIDIALREAGDMGRPLVATTPESVAARAFAGIAEAVAKALA